MGCALERSYNVVFIGVSIDNQCNQNPRPLVEGRTNLIGMLLASFGETLSTPYSARIRNLFRRATESIPHACGI
ncbi:unknown [Porphyromonas sp. CAG:1061]|nr:unknown [Porphyromonas sp. CAG:1061]